MGSEPPVISWEVFARPTVDISDQYHLKGYLKSGRNHTDIILTVEETTVFPHPSGSRKVGNPASDMPQAPRTMGAQYIIVEGRIWGNRRLFWVF